MQNDYEKERYEYIRALKQWVLDKFASKHNTKNGVTSYHLVHSVKSKFKIDHWQAICDISTLSLEEKLIKPYYDETEMELYWQPGSESVEKIDEVMRRCAEHRRNIGKRFNEY
jgi:hypothetical protein